MVFKIGSIALEENERPYRLPTPVQHVPGSLIAQIGNLVEQLPLIDDAILQYNVTINRILMRLQHNQRAFDIYVGLPFTKGVTERNTGRTELLLGTEAHHIDAMREQFEGVVWEQKRYGNTIRWINVGSTSAGFIGLDYNPHADQDAGVAKTNADVCFLSQTLITHGYDPNKKLFLLDPPRIRESKYGNDMRRQGYKTLAEYASIKKIRSY